jgi:hypothetical protein
LPLDADLGTLIDVDYYQSKESRMKEVDSRPNPIYEVLNQQYAVIQKLSRALSPARRNPSQGKR